MRTVVPVELDISSAMHYFTEKSFFTRVLCTFIFNVVILQIYWMQQSLPELSVLYPTLILITYTT